MLWETVFFPRCSLPLPPLSVPRLRFIVIPLHPENCFGKLLKPVLFLSSLRLRQRGDFISFSQFLGEEFPASAYRDAFDTDSTGMMRGKFTSIVDGCALLKRWLERISITRWRIIDNMRFVYLREIFVSFFSRH